MRSVLLLMTTCMALLPALSGCSRPAEGQPSTASSSASSPARASQVQRIAFVDQQEACECTRKRIDDSWAALQTAMKQSRALPVDRIHRDTQPAEVAPLSERRKFVAVPAIYLLDGSGEVLEMFQGEVTDKELVAALN